MQPKSPVRAANKSFGVEVNQNSFPQVKQLNIHKLFVAAHANANAIACTFQAGRKAKHWSDFRFFLNRQKENKLHKRPLPEHEQKRTCEPL
jgi:hypothetical protein